MRIGVAFANVGVCATPEGAHALAEACERLGVESVWTVEHVVVPAGYESAYPYSRTGRMAGGDEIAIADPLVWLGWVAARSSTLRLGTGVLILPQRNPLILAKEAASLDVLSRGRLLLGVGVGWLEEEFDALGVPFPDRGARTDEALEVLRALWSDAEAHTGPRWSFENARSYPKPSGGSVPVHVGGHSLPAARRAGRYGDGFFPAKHDRAGELVEEMRRAAEEAGRDPDAIELTTGASRSAEKVRHLLDLGFSRFTIPPPLGPPELIGAQLEQALEAFTAAR